MDLQIILQAVNELDDSQLQYLRRYIEERQQTLALAKGPRIPNLHPGAIQTTPDFDEPLPASFWLGEA